MNTGLLVALAALLTTPTVGASDRIVIRDYRIGRQHITTIETVPPLLHMPAVLKETPAKQGQADVEARFQVLIARLLPAFLEEVPEKKVLPDLVAKYQVLVAKSWRCGRLFCDDLGRCWHLLAGGPLAEKPDKVNGWLL